MQTEIYGFKKATKATERDGSCMRLQITQLLLKLQEENKANIYPTLLISFGFKMEIRAKVSIGLLWSMGKVIISRLKEEKQVWSYRMLVIRFGFSKVIRGKVNCLRLKKSTELALNNYKLIFKRIYMILYIFTTLSI